MLHNTFFRNTVTLIAFVLGGAPLFVRAQTTAAPLTFLTTWKADASAPSFFKGKILPSENTPVTVSFELLSAGKPVNVSDQTIYWYLNDTLLRGGVGLQSITFATPPSLSGTAHKVRIQINNYLDQNGIVAKTIEIPIVPPEVVIEAPFPGGVLYGNSARIHAWPFFFTTKKASDFSFQWSVNGQSPTGVENPQHLDIGLANASKGAKLDVGVTIKETKGLLRSATKALTLYFGTQ